MTKFYSLFYLTKISQNNDVKNLVKKVHVLGRIWITNAYKITQTFRFISEQTFDLSVKERDVRIEAEKLAYE